MHHKGALELEPRSSMCACVGGFRGAATYVYIYMLCAKYGLGQSVDCPAQSMDPQIAQ